MRGPVGGGLFGSGKLLPPAAGLVLWLDGESQAYSDFAATQPTTSPLGRVARVNQPLPAPAGAWQTPNETTQRAVRDPSGFDLQYGSTAYLAQPAGLPNIPATSCVVGFAFQNRISLTGVCGLFYGTVAGQQWGITVQNTIVFTIGSNFYDSGIVVPVGAIAYGVVTWGASSINMTIVVNGVTYNYAPAVTIINNNLLAVKVGSAVGNAYHAQLGVAQILAYNTTAVDTVSLLAFLKAKAANIGFPINVPLIAVAGDSISQGITATTALSEFYASQNNLVGNGVRMLQDGISGLGLSGLDTRYATEIKPFYDSRRAKNILMVQCMTNSMPCSSAQAAANITNVLAAYYAYCDRARADGWIVVLFTCLPRADVTANTGFPACWAGVNADIRANYLAHGADLADVSGVAGMSTIADAASGPNFTDQLHPNNLGQALMTPVVQAAITRRLAA